MTAETAPAPRGQALPSVLGPIRPRPRWTELRLLGLVAIDARGRQRLARGNGRRPLPAVRRPGSWHLPRCPARRPRRPGPGRPADRSDPVADDRAARRDLAAADGAAAAGPGQPDVLRDRRSGSPQVQLVWLLISLAVMTTLAIVVRSDSWLRRYKYTWAAAGVGAAAADLRARHRDQRPAADPPARAAQRSADRAVEGDPGRLPGRLPVGEPRPAGRAGHPGRAAAPSAASRISHRWSRCGRSPS